MHYTKSLQAEPRAARVQQAPAWKKNLPYFFFLLALAPDFKGGNGGGGARADQTLEFALFIIAVIWIVARKRTSAAPPRLARVSLAWWGMLVLGGLSSIWTVFPAPWNNQSGLDSFIVAIPGLIVGAVLLVSQTLNISGLNWFTFRKAILLTGLISATAQGAAGLLGSGVGDDAQLGVSLSTLFLFSMGLIEVVVPGLAFDLWSVISLLASIVLLGISTERTYLISAAAVALVAFLMTAKLRKSHQIKGFYKQLFGRVFLILVFATVAMTVLFAIKPTVFSKWQERITKFVHPSDQNANYNTSAIRISQFEYSARLLEDDPLRLAVGAGYQRAYPIIGSKSRFVFLTGVTYDAFSQADVLWYFPFLTSGLIGGLLFIGVYGTLVVVAVKRFKRLNQMSVADRWQTCTGIILLTTATASSVGINGLYFRFWSLMFGLSAAMLLSPLEKSDSALPTAAKSLSL